MTDQPQPAVADLRGRFGPLVMGVVNVTPDSFSDGGRYLDATAAIDHGLSLLRDGADILDIGGESTRPGAARVDEVEELRRVIPVIRELAAAGARVSVDTMRARVAERALDAGAWLINDVSAGGGDGDMVRVAADSGAPYVAMHWRGHSKDMNDRADYDDVVDDVCRELGRRIDALIEQGLRPEQVVADPGLGFAKNADHNWRLLAGLNRVQDLGYPVLVGASRKRFLGRIGVADGDEPRAADDRDVPTAAVSMLAAQAGAWGVRVHDVRATCDVLQVLHEVRTASREGDSA